LLHVVHWYPQFLLNRYIHIITRTTNMSHNKAKIYKNKSLLSLGLSTIFIEENSHGFYLLRIWNELQGMQCNNQNQQWIGENKRFGRLKV
jgi:hypothetical protein